jgi:hypothetical protein
MWSTLAGWLQHMPALPRLLLKTSNIYNFWSVGPKIMQSVLTRSLLQDASSQKVSKNLEIVWDQVILPKSGLVTPHIFSPLGVKINYNHLELKSRVSQPYSYLFLVPLSSFVFQNKIKNKIFKTHDGDHRVSFQENGNISSLIICTYRFGMVKEQISCFKVVLVVLPHFRD